MEIAQQCQCGCESIPVPATLETIFTTLRLGILSAVLRTVLCDHRVICSVPTHSRCVICGHTARRVLYGRDQGDERTDA